MDEKDPCGCGQIAVSGAEPDYFERRAEKLEVALEWMVKKYEELVKSDYAGTPHLATMMVPAAIARHFLEHVDEAVVRPENDDD